MELEAYSVNRETAAAICGVSDAQLKQWFDRNDLFPEKKQGRGYPATFRLADLMKIRAVAELVEVGVSVGRACEALRPYSIYGTFVHEGRRPFTLQRNSDGRWVGAETPEYTVRISINPVAVFEFVFPRFKKALRDMEDEIFAEALIGTYESKVRAAFERREQGAPDFGTP